MDEYTAQQMVLNLTDPPEKAIYVKLTPGTDLFNKVVLVSEHLEVTPTKAARVLMSGGFLSYIRTRLMDMRRQLL